MTSYDAASDTAFSDDSSGNSFTEAAELCHISQSGISQSIKALEDEIGAKLLIRKNRKFELTEAGKHFYKKSLVLTADLEPV